MMYGWRSRIGVLIPSGITITENDFKLMAPEGVACHYTRYGFTGGKPGDEQDVLNGLRKARDYIGAAVEILMHARPDLIIMTGTGTSFVGGHGYDRELIAFMEEKSGGIPATTTSTSVIEALKVLGVKRISVAAPYVEGVARLAVRFVEDHGVAVQNAQWLGKAGPEIDVVSPKEAYHLVRAVDTPESEAIFISCTNFDVLGLIPKLEMDLNKPIVTSNQASMWHMLRMAGIKDKIQGFGKLLSEY